MFCSNCGNKLQDGAKFCERCGTPTDVGTPQSGATDEVINKVNEVASDAVDAAAEGLDKAKVVAGKIIDEAPEHFEKAKEVGAEAFEQAKVAGAEAFDKAKEVGGEAFEQAKNVASETLDKAKVQLKEFNYEMNQNPNSNKLKIIIAAILVVLLCVGGALFWYLRPINKAERFVNDRTVTIVKFLNDNKNLSAKDIENELGYWGDGDDNIKEYVRRTGGLERNVKNLPYFSQEMALTLLGRNVDRNLEVSDLKIVDKGEYKIDGQDTFVFLVEKNSKKNDNIEGYLIGIAKNRSGDFYVDAWIPLNDKEWKQAEKSMKTGNFDRYK